MWRGCGWLTAWRHRWCPGPAASHFDVTSTSPMIYLPRCWGSHSYVIEGLPYLWFCLTSLMVNWTFFWFSLSYCLAYCDVTDVQLYLCLHLTSQMFRFTCVLVWGQIVLLPLLMSCLTSPMFFNFSCGLVLRHKWLTVLNDVLVWRHTCSASLESWPDVTENILLYLITSSSYSTDDLSYLYLTLTSLRIWTYHISCSQDDEEHGTITVYNSVASPVWNGELW